MANTSSINIFNHYNDLRDKCHKENSKATSDFNSKHYTRHIVSYKGSRDGDRLYWSVIGRDSSRPKNHQFTKAVRDTLDEAYTMRRDNFDRYIAEYNRRNADKFEDLDTLRTTSLWLDYNHECINGYHGVDTSTKYCPLHLKDENPRWYAGIELEVTFDRDIVGYAYDGDRYDENGDYDEEGDYDCDGELIENDFDLNAIAREVLRRGKGLFSAERDGSLEYGYSFELVSRPLSKRAWHSEEVVAILHDVLGYIKEQGGMVEQPEENGFHIHISRKFFEANATRSSRTIERDLNWVFQRYQEEIETIGGRRYNTWCQSAKMSMKRDLLDRYGDCVIKAQISKDSSRVDLPYGDHHRAFICSDSGYTYEARVFHSTLDPERVLACIEFMSDISHGARDNALEGKTFGQITKYKESPYLQKLIRKIKYEQKQKLSLNKKNSNLITVAL